MELHIHCHATRPSGKRKPYRNKNNSNRTRHNSAANTQTTRQTQQPQASQCYSHCTGLTDIDLAGYIFSFDNGTGTFSNDSYTSMTGTSAWSNVTKTTNATVGTIIQWRIFANDTSGNMNASSTYSFLTTTSDITPPLITIESPTNTTYTTTTVWVQT